MSELSICVISDLHCQSKNLTDEHGKKVKDSHIVFDEEFVPKSQDPIRSFVEKFKDKVYFDFLIIPGDLTSRAQIDGLKFGWGTLLDFKHIFKYKDLIVSIGNHDVDSRGLFYTNSLDLPKLVEDGFPHIMKDLNDFFWEEGFVVKSYYNVNFLIINTAYNYIMKDKSQHGFLAPYQIDKLIEYLQSLNIDKATYNIAVFHHHPITHDRLIHKTFDILENGRKLLNVLEDFKFNLVIHGHKHDPLISYSPNGANSIPIFSSGSFAAHDDMLKGAFNSCHFITLKDEFVEGCLNNGEIETYFFVPGEGWKSFDHYYFPHKVGFGCRITINEIIPKLKELFQEIGATDLKWKMIIEKLPMIKYMSPRDLSLLEKECIKEDIYFDPNFPMTPLIVSKKE